MMNLPGDSVADILVFLSVGDIALVATTSMTDRKTVLLAGAIEKSFQYLCKELVLTKISYFNTKKAIRQIKQNNK